MNSRLLRSMSICGAFFAGVLVGALLMPWAAPETARAGRPGTENPPSEALQSLEARIGTLEADGAEKAREAAALRRQLVLERVATPPEASLESRSEPMESLESVPLEALLDARARLGDDSPGVCAIVDEELRRRMVADPAALALLLARFRDQPDRHLAALLGSYRHPETEQVAVEMAVSSRSRDARLQALDLLDRLDHVAPEGLASLLDMIDKEQDPEVLGAGLYALPHGHLPPEMRSRAQGAIARAAEHPDREIRASAVLVLGMSPVGEGELDVVLPRLNDGEASVRATAAAALRSYKGGRLDAVRDALVSRMSDPAEPIDVRRQAWVTLSRFPLESPAYHEWSTFREFLAGLGDAESPGR